MGKTAQEKGTAMTDKTYDAGSTEDVRKAKRTAKILDNRERNGILKMTDDPEIRYVLSAFLDFAGPFRDTYVSDARDDARNSGIRSAGLWWLSKLLLHDPEILRKLEQDDDSPLKGRIDDDTESS